MAKLTDRDLSRECPAKLAAWKRHAAAMEKQMELSRLQRERAKAE